MPVDFIDSDLVPTKFLLLRACTTERPFAQSETEGAECGPLEEELRRNQVAIDEVNRHLERNRKLIEQNSEKWGDYGRSTATATIENEKHSQALDKQLQQLTARRLELTKGIKASLEYEAMQAVGVKTVEELDAATRARIESVAKEHAAVQAATEAKKSGAKADREALAAANAQENQYQSIIDRISRQIALDKEATLVTDKMTTAEKMQVIILEELKSAKSKISPEQEKDIRNKLAAAVATGNLVKIMQQERQAAEDLLRLRNELNEAAITRGMSNAADLMGIGRGTDAVEQMRRQIDLQEEYQRKIRDINMQAALNPELKASYDAQLELLRQYHEAALKDEETYQRMRSEMMADWSNGARAALEDYITRAKDIAGQTREIMGNALGGLEDTFTDFFTKGRADWKSYFADIQVLIVRFFVRQQLANLAKKYLPKLFGGQDEASALSGAAGKLAASAAPLLAAATALSASAAALAAAGLSGSISGVAGGAATSGWFSNLLGNIFPGKAEGGYTGPGGKYQPAGFVHKGEVVWSQVDIARAGGVAVVETMRRGMRGYADGGVVGGSRLVSLGNLQPGGMELGSHRPFVQNNNIYVTGRADKRSDEQRARAIGQNTRRALARTGR